MGPSKHLLISHSSPHHAVHSGYDKLIDYLDAMPILPNPKFLPYSLAKFISSKTNQSYGIYDSNSVYKDIQLLGTRLKYGNQVSMVHYLNAERDIRYGIRLKKFFKNLSFLGTFHKPPAILKDQITHKKFIEELDAVIAVGPNQVDFLKEWLQIKRVKYIPHGVDTQFFYPEVKLKEQRKLLFVGQHLRDFITFNKVAAILRDKHLDIKIQVVLRSDFVKLIEPNDFIEVHSGIGDYELRALYQKATLLFLPLLDSTACNSILEAMACGLPIITTDVGGNKEYLSDTENLLVEKGAVDDMVDLILNILKDENKQYTMALASRKKALQYDWKIVANDIEDFYKMIAK